MTGPQRPWPGLASFTEEQQAQFHGRDVELTELERRVRAKRLTLLFGQSGLGKSSLLQAGLLPRLGEAGYAPLLLRIAYRSDSAPPEQQILAALGWPGDRGLWEQLHSRQRSGPVPVLLFDQFEELFTLGAFGDAAQSFVELLADLAENRLPSALEARIEADESLLDRLDLERGDYRLLIALREDYLAQLEALRPQMPSVMQNRMRLAAMRGEQALQAACGPGGDLLSLDSATAIVRFVAGGAELEHAEVEPALLSLVLHELNEQRIAAGAERITADQLAGSHAAILVDFYERSLADLPAGVRGLIEDQLLTESGFRDSLSEERLQQQLASLGAPHDTLARLVERRLLRVEERLGQRRVELTHDVLCAVVQASRSGRREREAQQAAEAQLAREQQEFAQARRLTRRARWWTAGAALLGAGALAGAGLASLAAQRAQRAETLAATAQAEVQQVVAFLLDDFYEELQPAGQLEVVRRLSQGVLDYYAGLPKELQDGRASRGRALAQVRLVTVLLAQGQLDEVDNLLQAAQRALEAQYAAGDRGEALLIGLAQASGAQARLLSYRSHTQQTTAMMSAEIERLQPEVDRPGASQSLRRALAALHLYLGFVAQNSLADAPLAVRHLQAARQYAEPLGGQAPGPADQRMRLNTTSWLILALVALDRLDEARALAADDEALLNTLLVQRPDDASALTQRAALYSALGWLGRSALDPLDSQRRELQSRADWARLSERDPSATSPRNNLAVTYLRESHAYLMAGELSRAAAGYETAAKLFQTSLPETPFYLGNLVESLRNAAWWWSEIGEPARAQQLAQRVVDLTQRLDREGGGDAAIRHMRQLRLQTLQEQLQLARGEPSQDRLAVQPAPAASPNFVHLAVAAAHWRTGEAALRQADWSAAEPSFVEVLKSFEQHQLPSNDGVIDVRNQARVGLALAQLRQGRAEQARETLAPALAALRSRMARNHGSAWVPFEWAMARYVESQLPGPQNEAGQRAAALREARALLNKLPPEMRAMRSTQRWQRWAARS